MRNRIFPLFVLSAVLLGGCGRTEKEQTVPTWFSLDETAAAYVTAEQQGVVIPVSTDLDWSASLSDDSWCTLLTEKTAEGGAVTLQVLLNPDSSSRSLTLTVTSGTENRTVSLEQQGISSVLSATAIVLSGTAGQTLSLHTRGGWDLSGEIPGWLTLSDTRGVSGDTALTLSAADDNTEGESRSTNLLFHIAGGTVPVLVSQGQTDALDLSETQVLLTSDASTFGVTVGANVAYSVEIAPEAASWLSRVSTRAYEQHQEEFSAAANENEEAREATVVFRAGDLVSVLTVRQEGAPRFTGDPYQVGLYNYKGRNYLYTEGSDQYALIPASGGTHTLQIINVEARRVVSVGSIPDSPTAGATVSLPIVLIDSGSITAQETLTGTVSRTADGFTWISVPGNRSLIVK